MSNIFIRWEMQRFIIITFSQTVQRTDHENRILELAKAWMGVDSHGKDKFGREHNQSKEKVMERVRGYDRSLRYEMTRMEEQHIWSNGVGYGLAYEECRILQDELNDDWVIRICHEAPFICSPINGSNLLIDFSYLLFLLQLFYLG